MRVCGFFGLFGHFDGVLAVDPTGRPSSSRFVSNRTSVSPSRGTLQTIAFFLLTLVMFLNVIATYVGVSDSNPTRVERGLRGWREVGGASRNRTNSVPRF